MARKLEVLQINESPKGTTDRFNSLPDSIIHHIFSYLGKNDIPRIMCVSPSFKHVCMTSSWFDLEADFSLSKGCSCPEFHTFANRMLIPRGKTIKSLRLHWFCESCYYYKRIAGTFIDSWLQSALDNHLHVLDVGFRPAEGTFFILPHLQSLKELKLDLRGGSFVFHPSTFRHIVSLTLSNLKISETSTGGKFGERLCSTCTNIRNLCLEDLQGVSHINISSSSLEKFRISGWYHWEESSSLELNSRSLKEVVVSWCNFSFSVKMSINCPWLRDLTLSELKFRESCQIIVSTGRLEALTMDMSYRRNPSIFGSVPMFHCLDEMLFLTDAIVDLRIRRVHTELGLVVPNQELRIGDPCGYSDVVTLMQWLDTMTSTIALRIPIEVFKFHSQPPTFHNLQHLVVSCWSFSGDEDLILSDYLKKCLNLRTLMMELDKRSAGAVDDNVVYNLCLRSQKFVTKNGIAKMALFSFKDSELRIDPEKETARLLCEGIPNCDNATLEKVTYFF